MFLVCVCGIVLHMYACSCWCYMCFVSGCCVRVCLFVVGWLSCFAYGLCLLCEGWSEDLPTGKNYASERSRLGIVAGFNPPECKGEPPPGARAFLITLVPAPSKFKHKPLPNTSPYDSYHSTTHSYASNAKAHSTNRLETSNNALGTCSTAFPN
jgi:hypothetical protein